MSQSFVQEPGPASPAAEIRHKPSSRRNTVLAWLNRRRGRQELSSLDDRLLNDVGISREEAFWNGGKPFWKP
jgi:uncharacterized protein YjiS (DUF1127 family)